MSDVLIHGMEMPSSCDSCRIMVFEDTNCAEELYCGCPIVFKARPQGIDHRPDYCPLVSINEPHGRLGDLDALAKQIEYERFHHMHTDDLAVRYHIAEYGHFLKMISNTPTIIPAESPKEGET